MAEQTVAAAAERERRRARRHRRAVAVGDWLSNAGQLAVVVVGIAVGLVVIAIAGGGCVVALLWLLDQIGGWFR